jgi:hypothetical protein
VEERVNAMASFHVVAIAAARNVEPAVLCEVALPIEELQALAVFRAC